MNDEKLLQIQKELMKQLDEETKIEEEIVDSAEQIALKLKISNRAKANIDGSNYTFLYRIIDSKRQIAKNKFEDVKVIILTVANDFNLKVNGNKYRPFFCTAEMDMTQDLKYNLKAMVEAFIRHKTGRMKPEYIED